MTAHQRSVVFYRNTISLRKLSDHTFLSPHMMLLRQQGQAAHFVPESYRRCPVSPCPWPPHTAWESSYDRSHSTSGGCCRLSFTRYSICHDLFKSVVMIPGNQMGKVPHKRNGLELEVWPTALQNLSCPVFDQRPVISPTQLEFVFTKAEIEHLAGS